MKKIKIIIAVAAVLFAVGTSFTKKSALNPGDYYVYTNGHWAPGPLFPDASHCTGPGPTPCIGFEDHAGNIITIVGNGPYN